MVQVVWTNTAMHDLSGIRDYAAQVSTKYAEKLVNRLIARTRMLNSFPQSGRAVPEYGHEQIRELVDGRYRIIYEIVSATRIELLSIHPSSHPLTDL